MYLILMKPYFVNKNSTELGVNMSFAYRNVRSYEDNHMLILQIFKTAAQIAHIQET